MFAQDNFYKLCMRSFKNKDANDYDACVEIAQWLVVEFFEDRTIRLFGWTSVIFLVGVEGIPEK